jgi:hypothetical protein
MKDFVEKPHPALGGWAPCPYARQARLNHSVGIFLGSDPYFDLKNLCRNGLNGKEVVIYAYDPKEWPFELFHSSLEQANLDFLLAKNLIVLEDHPNDIELVNDVCMNQGQYALAMCQSLSYLDSKAQHLFNKGFYHNWPKDYLTGLFSHRQQPK